MKKSLRYSQTTLDRFPSLSGLVIDQGHGSFVELVSEYVPPCPECPQGVRFSLTLRDVDGRPLVRYAMAHNNGLREPVIESDLCVFIRGFDTETGRASDAGNQRVFDSVSEMLQAFFSEVDHVLQTEGEPQ